MKKTKTIKEGFFWGLIIAEYFVRRDDEVLNKKIPAWVLVAPRGLEAFYEYCWNTIKFGTSFTKKFSEACFDGYMAGLWGYRRFNVTSHTELIEAIKKWSILDA